MPKLKLIYKFTSSSNSNEQSEKFKIEKIYENF